MTIHQAARSAASILALTLISLLFIVQTSFAMGDIATRQPTWEGEGVSIKFVRSFGLPGKLPGHFFYPSDVFASVSGDLSTAIGDLFVADSGNERIERLEDDGDFIYQFGQFGTGSSEATFNQPVSVAVDYNYRTYVSDRNNHRIVVLDIRGNPLRPRSEFGGFGKGYAQLYYPSGIAVSPFGEIFIADSGNDRIVKFREDGIFLKSVGGFGVGMGFFDNPQDVAVDKDRNLYVVDTGNNRIQKIDDFDRPVFTFGQRGNGPGEFLNPTGIAVNSNFIVVSDTGNDRIQLFDLKGNFRAAFGSSGDEPGEFRHPQGLTITPQGKIFVADTGNHRVQVFEIASLR